VGAIQGQWNQRIRKTLTTPADEDMKRREKVIAEQLLESEMKKARDAPTPILSREEATIFGKGFSHRR